MWDKFLLILNIIRLYLKFVFCPCIRAFTKDMEDFFHHSYLLNQMEGELGFCPAFSRVPHAAGWRSFSGIIAADDIVFDSKLAIIYGSIDDALLRLFRPLQRLVIVALQLKGTPHNISPQISNHTKRFIYWRSVDCCKNT